ncbi:MAG: LURP-one-related family protein [Clostridia bacterium]|nr:LURP-one-related family protein [Clostridia bacterium]
MKYVIKNKFISLGGSSTVTDDAGNDLFLVKGKIFTFTKKKQILSLNKEILYQVRNKFFALFLPKVYLMDAEGNEILMIKKKSFFSLRQDFDIVTPEGAEHAYSIDGDMIGRHYDILDNGIPVAHVRRNFNLVKDSFWLETDMTENAPFFIAFVIALDNYYDKLRSDND